MDKLRYAGLAVVFLWFTYLSFPVGDTWWSLRLGEDFLAGRSVFKEQWSWSAPGSFYPNHEWLWETFMYVLWRLGSDSLALAYLVQGALFASVFALARPGREARRRVSFQPNVLTETYVLLLPLGIYLTLFLQLRAQAVSFALVALVLYLLRREKLRYIPLLFVPWASIHGGFIVGLIAIGVALLAAVGWSAVHRTDWPRVRRLTWTLGLSSLATLVNPLGWTLWAYIFSNTSKTATALAPLEWQPLVRDSASVKAALILAVLFCVFVMPRLRTMLRHWDNIFSLCIFLTFSAMALWVVRFLPFAFVAALPLLVVAWGAIIIPRIDLRLNVRFTGFAYVGVTALCVVLAVASSTVKARNEAFIGVPPATQAALASCEGNVYNDYRSGAFLIWWMKDHRVFVDTRWDPYPEKVLRYTDLTLSNVEDFKRDWRADCVFASSYSTTARTMDALGWTERYTDGTWTIWEVPPQQ